MGAASIPGCTIPTAWCEIHHVEPDAAGGTTHTDKGANCKYDPFRVVRTPECQDKLMSDHVSRTPPVAVRRALRQEVGFGCPVKDCGVPYLEYHHFDPPWAQEHHHDPARMIALCATHHAKAEAWTIEQLRALKLGPHGQEVRGRFEWMREDVLAVVGGSLYYETPRILEVGGRPVVWFERDAQNKLLLSLHMLTTSGEPRTRLAANDWIIKGGPEEVDTPPGGSLLQVRYTNGDFIKIRFRNWEDEHSLMRSFPRASTLSSELRFPLVTAEVEMIVADSPLRLTATETQIGGLVLSGVVMAHCKVGLKID